MDHAKKSKKKEAPNEASIYDWYIENNATTGRMTAAGTFVSLWTSS
jgi:hypothetical protein